MAIEVRFHNGNIDGWFNVVVYCRNVIIWDGTHRGPVDGFTAELIAHRALASPYNYMDGKRSVPDWV